MYLLGTPRNWYGGLEGPYDAPLRSHGGPGGLHTDLPTQNNDRDTHKSKVYCKQKISARTNMPGPPRTHVRGLVAATGGGLKAAAQRVGVAKVTT